MMYEGVMVQIHHSNLSFRWRCVVSFAVLPLNLGERAHVTHLIADSVGFRVGLDRLDTVEKGKVCCPCQESKPNSTNRPARIPLQYRFSYPGSLYSILILPTELA
jgi:hypothetical protein